MSAFETVLGYVGAAASKAIIVALVIFVTAHLFVDIQVKHPVLMLLYLLLVAGTFCLFGFIVGVWAKGFEQLQVIPLLIVTPLTFLGGAFYSIDMLKEPWRSITLFNPIVYLINGFRWTFFGTADVSFPAALAATFAFFLACAGVIWWIFRTGYRLKS
jgi:ABC-2 type transport system permease protein